MMIIKRYLFALNDDSIDKFFRTLAVTTSIVSCLLAVVGCSDGPDMRGKRVGVEGTVVLDGVPVQNARIMFIGDTGSGQIKAIGAVADGCFVINESNGPLPGMNRVEIHPETMDLEQMEAERGGNTSKIVEPKLIQIPAKYNSNSELTREVNSDPQQNKFDFELTSK